MKTSLSRRTRIAAAAVLVALAGAASILEARNPSPGTSYTDSPANPSAAVVSTPPDGRRPAPAMTFADAAGRPLGLEDFRGRTVLVNLWATWCPPCVSEMPALDALQARLGGGRFQVVAVSLDRGGAAAAQAWLAKAGLTHLAVYAGDVTRFGDVMLPSSFLVDGQGRVAWQGLGARHWDLAAVVAEVEKVAAEPPSP